jgi:hypothetical protein
MEMEEKGIGKTKQKSNNYIISLSPSHKKKQYRRKKKNKKTGS